MPQQGAAQGTYQTQRLNLVGSPQQRDGFTGKDQRFINMYPEMIMTDITWGRKYYLKKRPGLMLLNDYGNQSQGRGVYYWNGHVYVAIGNTVYQDTTPLITLPTSSGMVGFTEYNGTQNYLALLDGIQGWMIDTNGVATQITDANFPTPHIPTPVFMDGYLVVAKAGTADIWNSQLNDPFTWDPTFFMTAELYPDNLVGLTRNANYILAIGTESTEYIYDAASPTGSPFQTNPSAVVRIGSVAVNTIVSSDKVVTYVGGSNDGGRTVWLFEGFKCQSIATEPVMEALDDEGTDLANAWAFTVRSSGHKWYVLNLVHRGRTFVYDYDELIWHEWSSNVHNDWGIFNCNCSSDSNTGMAIMLDSTLGRTYYLDSDFYTDNGTAIYCQVTTTKVDFDTTASKFFNRVAVVGDSPNGPTPTPILIDWTDDDYDTFWPNPSRTINLNDTYSVTYQLGRSRRRAFRLTYGEPYELRLEGLDIDVNIGSR